MDYFNTHAPVCTGTSYRAFGCTGIQGKCYVRQADAPAAYLQGNTDSLLCSSPVWQDRWKRTYTYGHLQGMTYPWMCISRSNAGRSRRTYTVANRSAIQPWSLVTPHDRRLDTCGARKSDKSISSTSLASLQVKPIHAC